MWSVSVNGCKPCPSRTSKRERSEVTMSSYGDLTADELLNDRALRREVATLLAMTEAELLRGISRDPSRTLSDIYTPCPDDLEGMTVATARTDSEAIERIAYFTDSSTEDVVDKLKYTNGN